MRGRMHRHSHFVRNSPASGWYEVSKEGLESFVEHMNRAERVAEESMEKIKTDRERGERELEEMEKETVKDFREEHISRPPHYRRGSIEVWDFIQDQELDYFLGNVVKYVCRAGHKGDKLEDLLKAQAYIMKAIAACEEDSE